jgi:hypothetical protein
MKLALLFWTAAALSGQINTYIPQYCSTTGDVTLSAAGTTFTIQIASTATKSVVLQSALVTTSVASSFTQAVNGTNATSTAGTITQTPTSAPTITTSATSWTASNVGAGTAIGGKVSTPAGIGLPVNLTNYGYNVVLKPVANSNYSIIIASMTGTANITVCWREQ